MLTRGNSSGRSIESTASKINLSEAERRELTTIQRSRTQTGQVRRARLVLLLDRNASRQAIKHQLRCDSRFIKLAAQLRVPFMTVQPIWRKHDIRPHRLDSHMVSNDPDFETKAAQVIGLYPTRPPTRRCFA